MFANYIKLAFKVLARKKFFTFISLFGISFTLMILMLIASFLESEFGSNPPISDNKRLVFIPSIALLYYESDTIKKIDTVQQNGLSVYDTSYQVKRREEASSISMSTISRRVLDRHYSHVEGVEHATFLSPHMTFDVYIHNSKLTIATTLADAQYWKVFDFVFEEGRPFGETEIKNSALVAVITQKMARDYFGTEQGVTGKEIVMDDKHFMVIGLVKTPVASAEYISGDVFIPYTVYPEQNSPTDYFGAYMAVFECRKDQDPQALKRKLEYIGNGLPIQKPEEYNAIETRSSTYREDFAQGVIFDQDPANAWRKFLLIMIGFISLFVLLPVLNLINLNISRIMDRSSEIGVRKAFGAHTGNILFQFVFENIIQTLIGGLIGLAMALLAIYLINDSRLLNNVQLSVNLSFFLICFTIALFFGILSGLLPALKMSRLSIVNALKQHTI